jgi:hypothetical protein
MAQEIFSLMIVANQYYKRSSRVLPTKYRFDMNSANQVACQFINQKITNQRHDSASGTAPWGKFCDNEINNPSVNCRVCVGLLFIQQSIYERKNNI